MFKEYKPVWKSANEKYAGLKFGSQLSAENLTSCDYKVLGQILQELAYKKTSSCFSGNVLSWLEDTGLPITYKENGYASITLSK